MIDVQGLMADGTVGLVPTTLWDDAPVWANATFQASSYQPPNAAAAPSRSPEPQLRAVGRSWP